MKIKKLVLSLTLAGLCFNQASAQIDPYSSAASRSIGDSSTQDMRPTDFRKSRSLRDEPVDYAAALDQSILTPTADYGYDQSYVTQSGCSQGCSGQSLDLGCSSCGSSSACGCGSGGGAWFSAETLLWFGQRQSSPNLVNTSDFGVLPLSGQPGVATQFGGQDGINFGLIPGFRVSAGTYLGPEQKVGIGGRGYGMFSASQNFALGSDGSGGANPSIGIPFYNAALNQEDAFLVAFADGLGPDKVGAAIANSDLDMYGADGSLYVLLSRNAGHRMDLLGGYTYNQLKNSIVVTSESVNARFPLTGTITTTSDQFSTENVFHGGHLGVLSSVVRSRVSLSTLAKVSFGNMRQTASVRGNTVIIDTLGNPNLFASGILTQPSNIGDYSRDVFGFIPELGLKLGVAATENIQLTVGYTLMMWSDVAMAGGLIDSTVDPTQVILPGGTRPSPLFNDSTFWMQGVDLGMTMTF